MGEQLKLDFKSDDWSEAQRWLSNIDIWLVDHIDCRFTAKAQKAAKEMRATLLIMREYWERKESNELYGGYIPTWEYIDDRKVFYPKEEVEKKRKAKIAEQKKKWEQKYSDWIPSMHYHIQIVSTYVKKIQEWKARTQGAADDPKMQVGYKIFIEGKWLKDTLGNRYLLAQKHSEDFRKVVTSFANGARLFGFEIANIISVNPRTGKKKYSGDPEQFLYHYTVKMSGGGVGKYFKKDWYVTTRDANGRKIFSLNSEYLRMNTPQ